MDTAKINFFRKDPWDDRNKQLIEAAKRDDYLTLVRHIFMQDDDHPEEYFDEALQHRRGLQILLSKLLTLPPSHIADVGAGSANLLSCLANAKHKVIGVDISPVRVLKNRRKEGQGLDMRFGLAEDLPIKTASVDVVVSVETLEHVFDLDKTLEEFARVLNPNGLRKIFVQVPLHTFSDGYNHLRHFSPESLESCLRAKGFEPDDCAIVPYLVGEQPNNIFVIATLKV